MKYISSLILLFLLSSCSQKLNKNLGPVTQDQVQTQVIENDQLGSSPYEQKLKSWRLERLSNIKAPLGWLSVIGLHWLDEGENSIGSAKENKIIFDEGASPNIGKIVVKNDDLSFRGSKESLVTIGQDEHLILGKIESDAQGNPTLMKHNSYTFYVIKRGDKYGLRVKDTLSDARMNFSGIPYFPVNENLVLDGKVQSTNVQDSIQIQNAVGQIRTYHLEAKILFDYKGKQHELHALDGGPNSYFIIFGDKTTGKDSYGGGRFLYVDKPTSRSNTVVVDFNKSINPPCVFTDFATCPLPPDVNKLDFLVQAGEKNLKTH